MLCVPRWAVPVRAHRPACHRLGVDLTVAAIPFYFGSMEAERRWLQREAAAGRPSAADYTPRDTAASLAMGVGSLLLPLATSSLMKKVLPGKGRYPKVLVRTALAAAVATTLADVVNRAAEAKAAPDDVAPSGVQRVARRVAG